MADGAYVWAVARLLIDGLGPGATSHAAQRAEVCWSQGDVLEASTWRRVHDAILELGRQAHDGDMIH